MQSMRSIDELTQRNVAIIAQMENHPSLIACDSRPDYDRIMNDNVIWSVMAGCRNAAWRPGSTTVTRS
jgi:hypothetical protein